MTIQLNGHEVTFDVFEMDNLAAYQESCDRVTALYQQPAGSENVIDRLREMCHATLGFFEDCLGTAVTQEVFGDRLNVKTLAESFAAFTTAVNGELQQFGTQLAKPGLNRAQWRAAR